MAMGPGRRSAAVLVDVALLALVGALLVGVHALASPALQERLAFRHEFAQPLRLVTSAYVHNSDGHLWGNLVGFAAGAGYTYLVCVGLRERRWFWLTTLAFLTVLPALVHATTLAVFHVGYPWLSLPPSRGFSGVAAGFAGFLYVAAVVLVRAVYGRRAGKSVALLVFALLAGELLVIYSRQPPLVGGTLVVGLAAYAAAELLVEAHDRGFPAGRSGWLTLAAATLQVILVTLMLVLLVFGLFPSRLVVDGTFRNVFAHAAGLLWGVVIAAWGYRYWGTTTRHVRP